MLEHPFLKTDQMFVRALPDMQGDAEALFFAVQDFRR